MSYFPSKIILFGEQSLLAGSEGLAIPGKEYGGSWQKGQGHHFGTDIFGFVEYIERNNINFRNEINTVALLNDVQEGWFFDSNIPVGYGAGSSGAYSAAVYERYATVKFKETGDIKSDLALLESYFHGQSSGIDPLISYFRKPFHIVGGHPNEAAVDENVRELFKLIDTRIPRQGSSYIELFHRKMEDKIFADKIHNTLTPAVEKAIHAVLNEDLITLKNVFFEISYFQLVWMPEFIPLSWIRTWEHRLSENTGYLKLCGAGGGGFLIEYRG